MKRQVFVYAGLAVLLSAAQVWATDVAGDQSGIWTLAGSPYTMIGDVRVPSGEELTIEAGVEVIAQGHYKLTIDAGTLMALGMPGQEIVMTAADTVTGWRGLRLMNASDTSLVDYCVIEYAKGTGGFPEVRGGAIYINNCSPMISNCTLRYNYSHNSSQNGAGGGVCTESSSALILGTTIVDNIADSGGGVCTMEYGTPIVRDNYIAGNTSYNGGGGMYFGARSSPLIEMNIIEGNHSSGWGGGGINSWTSYIFYSTFATIRNNLIINNTANNGGGLYCRYDRPEILNNTIAYNSATGTGGGIYALNYPAQAPNVTNSILWGNTAPAGSQVYLYPDTGSAIQISYCDVQVGWAGAGNIDVDPGFVDGIDGDDLDLHIAPGSPCIDAGNNYGVPRDMIVDLDGNPRFVDDPDTDDTGIGVPPLVDMGCYEFQASECPADVTGDGVVDVLDLLAILSGWGETGDPGWIAEDIISDGVVNVLDLLEVLSAWGPC